MVTEQMFKRACLQSSCIKWVAFNRDTHMLQIIRVLSYKRSNVEASRLQLSLPHCKASRTADHQSVKAFTSTLRLHTIATARKGTIVHHP
eukprot:scaffold168260_cov19-Tisochrysis_lutea.AAC.2